MRESKLEKMLVDGVKAIGGECYKFSSPGRRGVPDRICLFDFDFWFMVEAKAPGGRVQPWQDREHKRLRDRGVTVYVAHDLDAVLSILFWAAVTLQERDMAMKPKKPKPKPRPC